MHARALGQWTSARRQQLAALPPAPRRVLTKSLLASAAFWGTLGADCNPFTPALVKSTLLPSGQPLTPEEVTDLLLLAALPVSRKLTHQGFPRTGNPRMARPPGYAIVAAAVEAAEANMARTVSALLQFAPPEYTLFAESAAAKWTSMPRPGQQHQNSPSPQLKRLQSQMYPQGAPMGTTPLSSPHRLLAARDRPDAAAALSLLAERWLLVDFARPKDDDEELVEEEKATPLTALPPKTYAEVRRAAKVFLRCVAESAEYRPLTLRLAKHFSFLGGRGFLGDGSVMAPLLCGLTGWSAKRVWRLVVPNNRFGRCLRPEGYVNTSNRVGILLACGDPTM